MAGYSQLAGNQWKSWMLPNGWKLSNGWKFVNGWKLLERLDDDKWLEISRKAGYCQTAGNEDNGWIFSNGWKLVKWLDFFGWLEIDSVNG